MALEGSLQVLGIDAASDAAASDAAASDARADRLGPIGSAATVAFAVKRRFDPTGVLPYPWTHA